ncbi:hypothetical protein Hypma_003500 [Hypsizygus marmoreus]|uniref:Uncharacterized protein n=1 Tax=Hypsizygus marmoreus TaxID=39966 RepID=A0A369J450_HYPMA|nr:hypothetical protein Hypma_003500 [Hypsizygus marmoreus]
MEITCIWPSFFHTPTISPTAARALPSILWAYLPLRCRDVHMPKLMLPMLGHNSDTSKAGGRRNMAGGWGDAETEPQGRRTRDGQGHMARLASQNP